MVLLARRKKRRRKNQVNVKNKVQVLYQKSNQEVHQWKVNHSKILLNKVIKKLSNKVKKMKISNRALLFNKIHYRKEFQTKLLKKLVLLWKQDCKILIIRWEVKIKIFQIKRNWNLLSLTKNQLLPHLLTKVVSTIMKLIKVKFILRKIKILHQMKHGIKLTYLLIMGNKC